MTQPDASTPSAAPTPSAGLIAAARVWRDDDPDPITRAELSRLLRAAQDGDPDASLGLADRFCGPLLFGTAGLRGPMGAGPHRMNRAVVIGAAAGLTAHLLAAPPTGPGLAATALRVVIGYDGRHRSADFAHDIAAVIAAAGGEALLLPRALPTPVLAFAVRHVGAHAGVMVTASHNPASDNGIKVYLGDGAQIAAPADEQIARQIAAVGPISAVPRADVGRQALDDTALFETVLDAYVDAVAALAPADGPRALSVVYTPLHGVGRDVLVDAFTRAGFAAPQVVTTQSEPDPDFPTVTFPNPEEPGALDAALEAARACGADLMLANDPDADRCAVAVPDPLADGGWRVLSGDEVGVLLGDLVLGGDLPADAVLANSIVSSRQLAALCARRGVQHVETLTGFKWIARVPHLRYGYEEALGYCIDPDSVRDKDGVSAALLVATLAAALRNQGRTLLDRLDDLASQTGVHASAQHSVRFDASDQVLVTMQRLRATPPTRLGGGAVQFVEDLADGSIQLPATDGLRYLLADQSRVVVRPSGTEPKLKAYLEVIEPVGTDGVPAARARAAARLLRLHDDVARWIQPHRPGR